jgi:hypothetical protein
MPVLLILILGTVMIIFWEFIKENVEVIGTLATSLAFLATAWAAYEARHSAKAAMRATQLTADSLIEMKKNSFKDWLELLLEQHNKMLDDVNQTLKEDKRIKLIFGNNIVKGVYSALIKTPVIIKYINHFTLILDYIDKGFYLPSSEHDEKKMYIKQLHNSINTEVNFIIAILGLNVDNNKTYNAKKLSNLLNDFNYFENELFFDDAVIYASKLDEYISSMFDEEYRGFMSSYVDEMIRNHYYKSTPLKSSAFHVFPRTPMVVSWSYNTPYQQHLLDKFNELSPQMNSKIERDMEESVEKVANFDSDLSKYVGWEYKRRGGVIKKIKIQNENQLKRLINFYFEVYNNTQIGGITLEDYYNNERIDTSDIKTRLLRYYLCKSYSMLRIDPLKKEIIDGIVAEVEKTIDNYKSELNKFRFK